MQFTFNAAFAKGSSLFKSRYGSLLGATVVFMLVLVGAGLVASIAAKVLGIETDANGQSWLSQLITIFFTNPFGVGLVLIALLHLRAESPGMSTLFAGFKRYWPLVGIGVLLMLTCVVPLGAGALVVWFTAVQVGGFEENSFAILAVMIVTGLVVFCVLIVLGTRLAFTSLLCIDPRTRLGLGASFATSWRMTGPIFWPLLGLNIVMGLILIGTTILLILPLFFVGIPLCISVFSAAYELAVGEHNSDAVAGTDLAAE